MTDRDHGRSGPAFACAIPGSRISPLRSVMEWPCPRCGAWITNDGAHLILQAPCVECRRWMRDQEGDLNLYDKRELAKWEEKRQKLGIVPVVLPVIDPEAAGVTVSVRSVRLFEWWVDISQLPEVLLNEAGERIQELESAA